MTRVLARALCCAIFGALAGAAAMILLSGLDPRFTLEMTQDRPGLLRGFYPGERDGELTFAWTADRAEIPLVGLDRNVPWTARVRVRGGRHDVSTLPTLTLLADNVPLATHRTTNAFEELEATIPARTGHVRGVTLALAVSNTFVPGPADARHLGVQVDRIAIEPATVGAFPPRRTVAAAALAASVFGAMFGLLAATATTAVGAATLLAVGQATVLRIGLSPFSPWLTLVESLAASIGIAMLLIALSIERWRQERLRHTARFALMFTGAALYLRLLVLLHPDKVLLEAVSHARRLEMLMAGSGLTYPVSLYVAALPFTRVVADHAALLWIVVAVAEAISFLFFYWMIVRGTDDRMLAAVAVAVVQLMPLGFRVLAEATLSSAFGQALSVVTISLATAAVLDHRPWQFLAAGATALAAFLSDATSFVALATILASCVLLLAMRGSASGRRAAAGLGAALVVAGALAAGFHVPQSAPVVNTAPATGLTLVSSFGWPFVLLAGMGLVVNVRSRRIDDWWLLVWGSLLAGGVLLVLRVFIPLTVLPYYAAMPAIAVLSASALVTLWNAGGNRRALAVASSVVGAALGVTEWLGVLGTSLV